MHYTHTQEYATTEILKAEQFQHKCMRQIDNEKWFTREKTNDGGNRSAVQTTRSKRMNTKTLDRATFPTIRQHLDNTHPGPMNDTEDGETMARKGHRRKIIRDAIQLTPEK